MGSIKLAPLSWNPSYPWSKAMFVKLILFYILFFTLCLKILFQAQQLMKNIGVKDVIVCLL